MTAATGSEEAAETQHPSAVDLLTYFRKRHPRLRAPAEANESLLLSEVSIHRVSLMNPLMNHFLVSVASEGPKVFAMSHQKLKNTIQRLTAVVIYCILSHAIDQNT